MRVTVVAASVLFMAHAADAPATDITARIVSETDLDERIHVRRPAKMNDLSGPNRTGCTAQIERAVR